MAAAPAVRTRITSLFGCRYPIVLPGMSWISTPDLVAAVSNAGESERRVSVFVVRDRAPLDFVP
jgi:NAD(P)H-dependent flavin oxidoreductase YrpB (nitropropane dioxygenase family)